MVAIGRSSHAFFFDGVSESIVIPQGRFTKLGDESSVGTTNTKTKKTPSDILSKTGYGKDETTKINSRFENQFTVEAWVIPDCGGIIAERENQFMLELGTVDTPGPAKFTVFLDTTDGTKPFTLTTASDATTRWSGVVYPEQDYGSVHDSYNRYDLSNYNDATNLNFNHRPLYHIVGAVSDSAISLFINGQVVISQSLPNDASITDSTAHVYIGGKGGDFRGAIESIHFATEFDDQIITPNVPMDDGETTTALYRFEEPLDIIEEEYEFTAFTAASNGTTTTLTIPATNAQALIKRLTGKEYDSTSPTIDFTQSPYSMGNYEINNNFTTPNTVATSYLPHVPYNLIINPGAINRNTQKPNQSPPERLRILSINGSSGVITVNSIHIDFNIASSGSRGILHSRTANVDNYFVIIPADLVIDLVTGKPYQPPHFNTQIIDKTGQMVLDETANEQHGIVYSSQMATTTSHPSNPFAVTWPSTLDVNYQIGHSGRHKFSHIKGHEYMRRYPRPTSLQIDQVITGSADIVQMDFSNTAKGVHRLFNPNELADFYSENSQAPITNVVNSAKASLVVTNGLPASKEEIIAIDVSDHKPFMLKGPIPENYTRDTLTTDERDYHIRPESESRIALLHVPTLRTTHNLAPYVEIHYNALDLLGDSMQAASASPTPMLMVEKTIPKGSTVLTGTTTVLDVIKADLADANKDSTIFSAGGYIDLESSVANQTEYFEKTNSLIGDNAGGAEYDFEISYATTPRKADNSVGYTPPSDINAQPATTPQVIASSHNKSTHQSVYHKLCIEPMSVDKVNKLEDLGNNQFKKKAEKVNSSTGVFDVGGIHQGSPIFEMFDIIDNEYIGDAHTSARIYIQPSNKSRTNQLAKLRDGVDKGETANIISLFYLMSRTRIRSVKQIDSNQDNSVITQITASGVAEEAINENVTFTGSGSPDSHVVKEVDVDAPVVSVTLGGPGQGAINTKPTYDPSPLMRLPGSTRRNCAVQAISVCTLDAAKTISVQPLNNKSEDIQSWGTYAFPKKGRIFLQSGGSAEYASKVGAGFVFDDTDAIAQRKYLSAGDEVFSTFNEWCIGVGLINNAVKDTYSINEILFNDDNFNLENMCEDGSTINDRLFQAIDDVTHDYQLGTQYASTRAMVEIPIFPQQFFSQKNDGIFPGPDNSMKLHLDATYTAHTWNPSPVGRRVDDLPPNDREVVSAYDNKNSPTKTFITKIVKDGDFLQLHVDNVNIFPTPVSGNFNNFKSINIESKVFLEDGSWAYISAIGSDFIKIRDAPITIGDGGYHGFSSDDFVNKLTTGCTLTTGRSLSALQSINSDVNTPTSDYEGRSIFYHDNANMQTQGGNLDYGLRQYVSAVEFKAGPLSNPHAPRTKTKRASATIIQAKQVSSQVYALELDNVDSFIDTNYTLDISGNPDIGIGDLLVVGKILTTTPIEVLYLGTQFNNQYSFSSTTNNTVLVHFGTGVTVPSLKDIEFRLEKIGRSHLALSSFAQTTIQELTVSTFRPVVDDEVYEFASTYTAGSTDEIAFDNGPYRNPAANSFGVNIRPGDMIYREDGTSGAIAYVGVVKYVHSEHYRDVTSGSDCLIKLTTNNVSAINNNDILRIGINSVIANDADAILNRTWCNPYAAGGLRNGDTVWMNMTMNNAHAVEGLFCKSRGVFNEGQVYKAFNGGQGQLANRPRDSIPLENFLIGDTCLETAINFVQHVNKTIELNYEAMGLSASQAPTVAYIDPYLSSDSHARVLLYDVAHDREFISFHDIHMQVQTSPSVPVIGHTRNLVTETGYYSLDEVLVKWNGGAPHYLTTQLDVANGFPSENKYLRSTQQSKFIESAYAHNVPNMYYNGENIFSLENPLDEIDSATLASPISSINTLTNLQFMGKGHGHFVHSNGYHGSSTYHPSASSLPRTEPATQSSFYASKKHNELRITLGDKNISPIVRTLKQHRLDQSGSTFEDNSTFFDTPDGTRVISAFLCLKGIRNENLNLVNHEESRLQHLPQWTQMDYIRRQTIDFGEVGVKVGGTDIEAAAREIVRMINQGAAKNGRTHARRPSSNYPGESERMDLTRIGVREDVLNPNKDPASAHVNADFAATGSTHDPAPFWSVEHAMTSQDRGSHMGYLRAHLGRIVEDNNGVIGYTIVIHSTVPGASGRNFCVWLDNSKGQSPYQPKFLIGHGGRFRNFWCQQDELMGENMHPAPMPLNKDGRPFAPITSLRELVKQDNRFGDISNNNDDVDGIIGSGSYSNTVFTESFEGQSQTSSIVEGLRVGTRAIGRINFGGLVASGIPGFAPTDGEFGVGNVLGGSSAYLQYTNVSQYNSSLGEGQLYGFRLTDHRGKSYGVRYVYKQLGEEFFNDNTFVPNTLSEEVGIFINHKDISEGGFTIKNNITGLGDVTGQLSNSGITTVKSYNGNRFNGVYSPDSVINASVKWESTNKTLTVKFYVGSIYNPNSASELQNVDDILGYLGFPKTNGVIQLNDTHINTTLGAGFLGHTLSYTSRTQLGVGTSSSSTHIFYGVKGSNMTVNHQVTNAGGEVGTTTPTGITSIGTSVSHPSSSGSWAYLAISSRMNWTTLLTDEVLAAATEAAINATNVTTEEGISFDCRHLLAADGRTLGDWGVSADAIRIRAFDVTNEKLIPPSTMFECVLDKDRGIEAAHQEYGLYTTLSPTTITASTGTNKPLSDIDIGNNKFLSCGYIPKTVLQIVSKGRGFHANTPTPILVDSTNNPIDISNWSNNLKGISYTRNPGDHILPCVNEVSVGVISDVKCKTSVSTVSVVFGGNKYPRDINLQSRGIGGAKRLQTTAFGTGFVAGTIYEATGGTGHGLKLRFPYVDGSGRPVTTSGGSTFLGLSNGTNNQFFELCIIDTGEGYTVGDTLSVTPASGTPHNFTVLQVSNISGFQAKATNTTLGGTITAISVSNRGTGASTTGTITTDYITLKSREEDFLRPCVLKVTAVLNEDLEGLCTFSYNQNLHGTLVPTSIDTNTDFTRIAPKGETGVFFIGSQMNARLRNDGNELQALQGNTAFVNKFANPVFVDTNVIFVKSNQYQINGRRFYGSVDSEPIVYFRGAKDSVDHSVPLYFGGGFTGVTMDINDGTQNDYSSFYTHPYSNGPTGTAGIQNANEISTSFATIDCNALFAFFPGAALVNQNRGSYTPPVFNKDNILSPDIFAGHLSGNDSPNWLQSKYSAGVIKQKPTPLVLQFAHPTARYDDYIDAKDTQTTEYTHRNVNVKNKTSYHIYGPGQAIPFSESTHDIRPSSATYPTNTIEPHPGTVVTVGNSWSKVPYGMNLPNELINDALKFAPPTSTYQVDRHKYHFAVPRGQALNWSPPEGIPNIGKLKQRPSHGYHYGEHFIHPVSGKVDANNSADYRKAHPYKHCAMAHYGIAMSADMTWHMDGGYHPGGHWLDNQVAVNFKNHTSGAFTPKFNWTPTHPTAFRVSSRLVSDGTGRRGGVASGYNLVDGSTVETESDIIIVDATRCQNGEELATIIGQAINENPGKGALKALGGTFMPSMGNANRQDRYGWVELEFESYNINGGYTLPNSSGEYFGDGTHTFPNNSFMYVVARGFSQSQTALEQIPMSGWIRTDKGGREKFFDGTTDIPMFAPYHTREIVNISNNDYKVVFWLAPNRISGLPLFEDGYTFYDKCETPTQLSFPSPGTSVSVIERGEATTVIFPQPTKVFVWSKAGVHRFNNENEPTRDHMTQVHFSGLVDAIDRTRPVGAVGWAGERYSYLNSLKVETDGGGNKLYAAGLGAWYEKLGFSPYGSSNSCMGLFGVIPSQGIQNSPDASPIINGRSNYLTGGMGNPYTVSNMFTPTLAFNNSYYSNYTFTNTVGSPHFKSVLSDEGDQNAQLGVYGRAFLVVSHESELPLVAKYDRDGIRGLGDWLNVVAAKTAPGIDASTAITFAGTTRWDERFHGSNRFIAPATAGPKVEALITPNLQIPTDDIPALGVHESFPLLSKTEAIDLSVTLTPSSSDVTTSDTKGLAVGMYLSHANLPINTQIVSITNSTTFVISTTPTSLSSPTTVTARLIAFGEDDISNATPCLHPTGDISTDSRISPATKLLNNSSLYLNRQGFQSELNTPFGQMVDRTELQADYGTIHDNAHISNTNAFNVGRKSVSRNFTIENIVWKRMDGGNLSLPSLNAKGLGAVPFITRVKNNAPLTMGEKIFGNNRFTFETTNSSMFPIIQAQELMHPQLATKFPSEIKNALIIPNEEIQFQSISVEDDTGQVHTIEGGSPFGTIIRGFRKVSDRASEGLAPAVESNEEKYVGVEPNLEIQLPDPNTIPGNILVRSGFDSIQAYQHETLGSGGMMRPSNRNHNGAGQIFDEDFDKLNGLNPSAVTIESPRLGPTYEDYGWEHISQDLDGDIRFPDSTKKGWTETTGNNPLNTSYKLHDRSLFFHITKKAIGFTEKFPVGYSHANGVETQTPSVTQYASGDFTLSEALNVNVFAWGSKGDLHDINRNDVDGWENNYFRIRDTTTGREALVSGVVTAARSSANVVRNVVLTKEAARILFNNEDIESIDINSANFTYSNIQILPSFPVTAGNTRLFAARRMRDHSEVSGNSPDARHQIMKHSEQGLQDTIDNIQRNRTVVYHRFEGGETPLAYYLHNMNLSPMAIPRMGHHFVNATMAVMPGHWAHPAYQNLYHKHRACRSATLGLKEKLQYEIGVVDADTHAVYDPLLVFGGVTATPSGPSDIHGGSFSLMFETKIKHDGYGILASEGEAGTINAAGGHTIVLRAGMRHTFNNHFPDPSKVGAYQIIIQPNVFSSQFIGFHQNGPNNDLPNGSVVSLTSQQVALVVGIRELDTDTGGMALVLANATMADVRGCEVMINEVMLDHDPDHGGQFTNIPNLMTYNPFGVQSTEAPAFTRHSLPYHPQMFVQSTPGMTTNIPWWSIVHPQKPTITTGSNSAKGFRFLSHHRLDNYYLFIRANAGSIGAQLTLAGYPSTYPNMYDEVLRSVSLNPNCKFISESSNVLTVDDASDFPIEPMYGEMIYYIDANGVRRTSNWSSRSGFDATNMNKPKLITLSSPPAGFVSNLTADTILRLTKQNDTSRNASEIFTDSERSIMTRTLPQTLQGSRDTNSLHVPDAFICTWSPNLERPNAPFLDYRRNPTNHMYSSYETIHYHDSTYYASLGPFALDIQTPKIITSIATNRLVASHATNTITTNNTGVNLSVGDRISVDGRIYTVQSDSSGVITVREDTPNEITVGSAVMIGGIGDSMQGVTGKDNAGNSYRNQGGSSFYGHSTLGQGMSIQLNNYWPCGSRGGPITSRLDGFGYVSTGWMLPTVYAVDDAGPIWHDDGDDGSYDVNAGVDERDYENSLISWGSYTSGDMPNTRPRPFGYRFGLRQPYNKPRWAWYGMRTYLEQGIGLSFLSVDYKHGPLVEARHRTSTWIYAGGESSPSGGNSTFDTTYVGILERQTNFAGMENMIPNNLTNTYGRVTRYSDGMRMTRPFGCPVRTIRNESDLSNNTETNLTLKPHIRREWLGDDYGHGLVDVAHASQYYLVDWWGNTRGEDVRRMPVRGFGVSPAWSPKEGINEHGYNGPNKFITGGSANPYNPFYMGHSFYNFKKIISPHLGNGQGSPVLYQLVSNAQGTAWFTSPYDTIPSQVGNYNAINSGIQNEIVDFFFPATARRVGDEGGGRGNRYPTAFNQQYFGDLDILDELPHRVGQGVVPKTKGAVLSYNTAEPNIGDGYIRPKNSLLGTDEVPRGISARLLIDDYGLLKPEATLGARQLGSLSGTGYSTNFITTPYSDVISRSSPKIGLDVENFEGIDNNAMIVNTEAHSLHTNRQVGQRGILQHAYVSADINLISVGYLTGAVSHIYNNTSMFKNIGGTNILDLKNYSAPVDLGSWGNLIPTNGLVLWLDAESLQLNNGDNVAEWKDQSGNNRHVTQSVTADQPTYVASDAAFNGKSVVNFATDDVLTTPFDAELNTNEFTTFVVMCTNNDNSNYQAGFESRTFSGGSRRGYNIYANMTGSNNRWEFWVGQDGSWNNINSANGSAVVNQPNILTMFIEGGNGAGASVTAQTLRVDGTQVATATPNYYKNATEPTQVGRVNDIGSGSTFSLIGKVAEVIKYNRHLTDAEMGTVEGYLSLKYNISGPTQNKSSNPYVTSLYNTDSNKTEKEISLMLRPIKKNEKDRLQFFSFNILHTTSPQYIGFTSTRNYNHATVGGKYGIFAYDMPNARASEGFYLRATNPDTNPPYAPMYNDTNLYGELELKGHRSGLADIGTNGITFTSTVLGVPSINNDIGRVVITENTLQHYRADASRKKTINEDGTKITRKDYTVQPRFSQSLHPKGHKGDVSFNEGDHTNDGS
jgi:hypothetical protein